MFSIIEQCLPFVDDCIDFVMEKEPTRLEIGSGTAKEDHLVQFGCHYVIIVQSSPVANPARSQIVNTTVPGFQIDSNLQECT